MRRHKPTVYFVDAMSDLFHPQVPDRFIEKVFEVMKQADWHTFQVLTKRPERMAAFLKKRRVPSHIWLGTSAENKRHGVPRIDHLRQIRAAVRFLSVEPLLEDLGKLDLRNISCVIVGEPDHKARACASCSNNGARTDLTARSDQNTRTVGI